MSSEIEQYQAAKSTYESATRRCEEIVAVIDHVARALRDWKKVMVSNASVGFPADIALSRNRTSIDANNWFSGAEIASALAEYHQAKMAMTNAFNAIPDAQRGVIVPPPA